MQKKVVLPAESDGRRLDTVLPGLLELSRSNIAKFFKQSAVKIEGQVVKPSYICLAGQNVTVDVEQPSAEIIPVPKIPILYEDEDLIVIDKPAGLAVHLSETGRPQPTVAAFAESRGIRDGDKDRSGIVHRLDKDTSGVMVISKNSQAKQFLQKQFADRAVSKKYLTLVSGRLKQSQATISLPLTRSRKQPVKRAVVPGGKMAVTHYRVIEELPGASLIEVSLETGRTHQVRVHFAHLGHPVVGDQLYGVNNSNLPMLKRQFLHSQQIAFTGPSGQKVEVSSLLPPDLSEYLENLKRNI